MKTDQEIYDFIDSKDALTKRELSQFMYGYKSYTTKRSRINKFWGYVLATKNWARLKEYRHHRERVMNRIIPRAEFAVIYYEDKRLQTVGKRRAQAILRVVYDINLSLATVGRYLSDIRRKRPN